MKHASTKVGTGSCFNEAPAKGGGEWNTRGLGRRCAADRASMRPPQKAGGNVEVADRQRTLGTASMRPPQKAGGNVDGGMVSTGWLLASMRPPQKAGGNWGTDQTLELGTQLQ